MGDGDRWQFRFVTPNCCFPTLQTSPGSRAGSWGGEPPHQEEESKPAEVSAGVCEGGSSTGKS